MYVAPMKSVRPRRARAALLLEVLIALTIMVAALGLLGAQLMNGLTMTYYAHEQTRVNELADRLLALMELDLETQAQVFADEVSEGDFGDSYPGYHWRVQVEQAERDVPGLMRVVLEVLRQEDSSRLKDIRGATVLRTMALLKADPARIDLAADFGFSEDMIAQLTETVPIPGFDPSRLDIQALVAMEPMQLLALLPTLLPILQGMLGIQGLPGDPSQMSPEQLQQFILEQIAQGGGAPGMGATAAGGGFPGGGPVDPNNLADMIRNEVMARGGPGSGQPDRGGQPFDEVLSDRAPGGEPAGPGAGPEADALAEMIRQRAIEAGAQPGMGGAGRRGARAGGPGAGGMGAGGPAPGGMDSGALEDMIRQRVQEAQGGAAPGVGAGGGQRGGRGAAALGPGAAAGAGRPGAGRPGVGQPGVGQPGAGRPGAQQPATIEDLMRMRDEFRSGQGGRRR